MIQTVTQVDSATFTSYKTYTYPVGITSIQNLNKFPITLIEVSDRPQGGLCKPSTSGLMFLRQTCTSWIISQTSQQLGDKINR